MKRIYCVLIGILLMHCGGGGGSESGSEKYAFAPGPYFTALENIRSRAPVDFTAMSAVYTKDLSSQVKASDSAADDAIMRALEAGARGVKPHVQSQIVSKQIQKAFFGKIIEGLHQLKNTVNGQQYAKILAGILNNYEVVSPTVVRRSLWAGREREMEDAARMMLKNIGIFPARENQAGDIRNLEDLLVMTYVYSIYYELDGIKSCRGSDPARCEEKQAEAQTFFETVEKHSIDTGIGAVLDSVLSVPYMDMDVASAENLVMRAFGIPRPEME